MDTIAALATPEGIGSIAVIRISGSEALDIASKVFTPIDSRKSLAEAKGYTALFGHFIEENKVRDEVVALVFRAPLSYTGEDVVELSCHGGSGVCNMLLHELYAHGAVAAERGEFTKRAFLNSRISLTQAEAVMDMINASSTRAINAAAAAMQGNLYAQIQTVQQALIVQAGHIAAYTDYPEEGVEELQLDDLSEQLCVQIDVLQRLCADYGKSAVIKNGVKAAIVGSPNVGKSTLLNLLSGFDRAIVTSQAGTTRDVVEQEINIAGIRLILADTAGLRDTDNIIETEGIRRSYDVLQKAEMVIAVFDSGEAITEKDMELAKLCQNKNSIAVINKQELERVFDASVIEPFFGEIVYITAKDNKSIGIIEKAIEKVLNLCDSDTTNARLASERQYTAAQKALLALQDANIAVQSGITLDAVGVCIDDALAALYSLTGESAGEDIINEVFSKFCVGK